MNKEYLFDMKERLNNMRQDMRSLRDLLDLWDHEIDEFTFVIDKDLEDYDEISLENVHEKSLDHFFYIKE